MNAPILADQGALTDAIQPNVTQELLDLMAACPHSWAGDEGFYNWCEKVFGAGAASVTPPAPPPPQISALDPASLAAGALNVKLTVVGTGVSASAVILAAGQDQTTVVGASAYLADALVAEAGSVQIQVRNPDGTLSNSLDLTVT